MTTTINVEIDEATAGIYTAAPQEDRNRLSVLWGVLVREYQAAPSALGKLMDENRQMPCTSDDSIRTPAWLDRIRLPSFR